MELLPNSVMEADYAVKAVDWVDSGVVDFMVGQLASSNALEFRALISPDTQSVHVVDEALHVPEPPSLLLALVALMAMGAAWVARNRERSSRSASKGK